MPKSVRNCCVTSCKNTERSCENSNIKFYSFPGKSYEMERRQQWIKAVNRKNEDGSLWVPTKYSRICSAHFVGGQRSSIQFHPAYIPTIFSVTRSQVSREAETQAISRFERHMKRINHNYKTVFSPKITQVIKAENEDEEVKRISHAINTKNSVKTQCCFDSYKTNKEYFVFESTLDGNNFSTQCNINVAMNLSNVVLKDQKCGPYVNDVCKGFHGYIRIKEEKQ